MPRSANAGCGVGFSKVVQQGGQISPPGALLGFSGGGSAAFPGSFDAGAADESGAGQLLICRKPRRRVTG